MNRTIKRLVIPVGVAAVVSTAGFAFMAGNTVASSSAGEGDSGVSGYTVSGVNYSAQQGWGRTDALFSVSAVKFVLTSVATSAPANGQPANVNAALLGTASKKSFCQISGWTVNGAGQGTGPVTCTFGTSDHTLSDPVALEMDVTGLDVTANQ
jgi:hypothetical protein